MNFQVLEWESLGEDNEGGSETFIYHDNWYNSYNFKDGSVRNIYMQDRPKAGYGSKIIHQ